MQCGCKERISQDLMTHFKEQHPDSTDHRLELGGYSLIIGETLESRVSLPVTAEHTVTAKTGRRMVKKVSFSMMASYCPFCGKPAKEEAA